MARETWTDERLNDLTKRIDRGFDETKLQICDLRSYADKGFDEMKLQIRDIRSYTDKGFHEVKGEIREVKEEVSGLRAAMNARLAQIESRLDANQRIMVLGFASIVASILATQL